VSATHCRYEHDVLAALRRDSWAESLRGHVAGCPVCAEVAFVAALLLDEARAAETEASLPDPGRIWSEAQLRARQLKVVRATRPIRVVQWVAVACALAVAVVGAARLEPHIGRWLAWLRPPSMGLLSGLAFFHGVFLLIASIGFVVLAGYAVFSSWRES